MWLAVALTLSACSLLLDSSPEGLPCDQGRCLEGYGCVDGKCVQGAPVDQCGGCAPDERCGADSLQCLPASCAGRKCGAGQRCEEASGLARCVLIDPPGLGRLCVTDAECAADAPGRLCMQGAIKSRLTGDSAKGICVEPCGIGGQCSSAQARCERFALGLDAGVSSLCVPANSFYACINDRSCRDNGELVCTLYDHPALEPISLCDEPLPQGASIGERCVERLDQGDGGNLCKNGLCLPQINGEQIPRGCAEPCELGTCAASQLCLPSELTLVSSAIRHVPVCVSSSTQCLDCSAGVASCGVDAPHCVPFESSFRCLSACSPDAGFRACPEAQQCADLDGGNYCLPTSLSCP